MDYSFEEWMNRVDQLCQQEVGLSTSDLADMTWRDYYESDLTPAQGWRTAKEDGVLT